MGTVAAIIPAAGKGERLGVGIAKALHRIGASSLLSLAAKGLADAHDDGHHIDCIVVAAPSEHLDDVLQELAFLEQPGVIVVAGGATRQQSVANALAVLPDDVELVLVHDAARALTPAAVVARVLDALHDGASAVIPAIPVADTVKVVEDDAVMRTLDRSTLRAVQTPQGFTRAALELAHQHAQEQGLDDVTDDAGLCERAGIAVRVVDGDPLAFKITRPLDLVLAEAILGGNA